MVEMIMSMMVIVNENRKKILRALNIIHEVEFNENGKAWFLVFKIRLVNGGGLDYAFGIHQCTQFIMMIFLFAKDKKTGWDFLVLGYASASLEIKTLEIKDLPK